MQIINDGKIRILVPDKGYILVHKSTGIESCKFYLGKFDTPDNYTEIADPDFVKEDDSMNIMMKTVDELISVLNPVIASMPLTLEASDEDVPQFIKTIAMFYEELINRGLKLKKDVPEPYIHYIKD